MIVGPLPARMWSTASVIAVWTARASMPSTRQLGMPKPAPRRREAGLAGGLGDVGGDGVLVVLDEEAHRQLPGGGEVEGLQHGADVDRTVAEVGHRDRVAARVQHVPREAGGLGHAAADDGVGAHRPGLAPLQVHRPAAAAAVAVGESADLGQRPAEDLADLGRDLGQRGRTSARATWPKALARNWWWPRCEPLTKSSERSGRTEPTAPPSWPTLEWAGPWIRPWPASSRTYSSKDRIHCARPSSCSRTSGSAESQSFWSTVELHPGDAAARR